MTVPWEIKVYLSYQKWGRNKEKEMKEEKQIKVKKKVHLQMCRQRQKTPKSQRTICKSLRRCSGLNTNGLVVWLIDLIRLRLVQKHCVRGWGRGGG